MVVGAHENETYLGVDSVFMFVEELCSNETRLG
jgi:hypothetical protein